MQIITTMIYHLPPAKIAVTNKSTKNKCWQGWWEKGALVHCWWECRQVKPLWKIVWNFLKKLKMEMPFDPAILLLGICPKNPKTPVQKSLCAPMFIAVQFTIAKIWKQPEVPISKWVGKKTVVHLHRGILCSRKKKLLPFTTASVELESVMLNEVSQAVKDKYHVISPISGT